MNGELEALSSGQLYRFADWPNYAVPAVAAGAYTVAKDTERDYFMTAEEAKEYHLVDRVIEQH